MKKELLREGGAPAAILNIDLVGPMRITDAQGRDITPTGKKNRGLLAILCVSPNLSCSRAKLQDKLWSDRKHAQGSNSLRQALTLLRRVLNEQEEVLQTNEDWVELDADCVKINLEPRGIYPVNLLPEFAEGLHVNDPEFENWIRDQRSHFERLWLDSISQKNRVSPYPYQRDAHHVRATPTLLLISAPVSDDPDFKFTAEIILREAAKRACSYGDFVVVEDDAQYAQADNALRLSCLYSRSGEKIAVHLMLLVEKSRRTIWNQTFEVDALDPIGTSSDLSDALTLGILKSGSALLADESLSADLPLGDIFGYSQVGLYSADSFLRNADREREVPTFLSLRAYIRHTMIMERVTDHPQAALDEAEEMVSKALERAPYDPFTLAVRSLISGLNDQDELALDYARRAVQSDQNNAFAQHCLSVALSFSDFHHEADQAAMSAQSSRLAVISPAIYYQRSAYTALGIGNEREALRYAKMAHGAAPNFRPALRMIAALSFREHKEDVALKHLKLLQSAEPDFTLELMGQDDYPVDSLRKAGALSIVTSKLI